MKELFDVCSRLTYVIECIAADSLGEAKFELRKLIADIEASALPDAEDALAKLREAQDLYQSGDFQHAGICTSSASRQLQAKLRWPEDSQ